MSEYVSNLFDPILTALLSAEKRHRSVYEQAFTDDDFESTARESAIIPSIIRWRKTMETLRTDIAASGAISEEDLIALNFPLTAVTDATHEPHNDELENASGDDIKIGKYIRQKLRELCASGYEITHEQALELCDVNWGRRVFSYDRMLPFAKFYTDNIDISEQTKDNKGYNRYWKEIFSFGSCKLLVISQWYMSNKDRFDQWYDSLVIAPAPESSDELYTGKKPRSITLFGATYAVRHWNEVFVKVCEKMVLRKPYIIATFDKDTDLNSGRRQMFSYIQSEVKFSPKRLTNGLYIETNYSAVDTVGICHRILSKCGYTHNELKVDSMEE